MLEETIKVTFRAKFSPCVGTTKNIPQGFYASTTSQIFPQQPRYLKVAFNFNLKESKADSCSPTLILTYCCEATNQYVSSSNRWNKHLHKICLGFICIHFSGLSLSVATMLNNLMFCFYFSPREWLQGMLLHFEGKHLSHLDAGSAHKAAPLCCWPLSCTTRAGGCLGSPLNGFSAVILESIDFMFCILPRLCM